MTVDSDPHTHPQDSPRDETILSLLEEHKALPTTSLADEIEEHPEAIRDRLQMMATAGLIERRETINGEVWLAW